MLGETPHKAFLDLAAVFYVSIVELGENALVTVNNRMMEKWKPDMYAEELYSH